MHSDEKKLIGGVLSFPLPDLEMILVEGHQEEDSFMMGDDNSRHDREKPAHAVHIAHAFYMGKFLVTQRLYQEVMGKNPSRFKGERRPVESISWNDAKLFIERLQNRKEVKAYLAKQKMANAKFRLPSEAEWEFTARGGIRSQGYEYCGSDDLNQVGWYYENSGGKTKPVGLLYPNELGLYDMSGNVYEWCEDDWHGNYDSPDRPDDGSAWIDAPDRGADRVLRGGDSFNLPIYCRPAYRFLYPPGNRRSYIGFRLVLSLQL